MMVVSGKIDNIKITAVASDFDFLGASMAAAEGEAFLYGIQYAIENQTPFLCVSAGGGMRMMESLISLSQMTRTTLAISELKKIIYPIWFVLQTQQLAVLQLHMQCLVIFILQSQVL